MPPISIKYVFWERKGKRLHGGTTTVPVPDDMLTNGKARVLFWSVVGAAGGSIVSFTQAIPSFSVGAEDIYATAFCVTVGPNGPAPNECYIDAFDIDTGMFLDNDFVSVYDKKNGPKNQALSLQANEYGTVPTSNNEFAFADIPLPEQPFQYWKVISGTMSQNGNELDTTPDSKGAVAFAFYQKKRVSIPFIPVGPLTQFIIQLPGGAYLVPGGGIIPPCDPEVIEAVLQPILVAAQQCAISVQVSQTLRNEALNLTAKQLEVSLMAIRKSLKIHKLKAKK